MESSSFFACIRTINQIVVLLVLRPVASAQPNLASRAVLAATKFRPYDRANGLRVVHRALQMDAQTRLRPGFDRQKLVFTGIETGNEAKSATVGC